MTIDAAAVRAWVQAYADAVAQRKVELTELDAAIGDGDHGINMDRGMQAAVAKLAVTEGTELGGLLRAVGMALVSKVGGASGPLYGTLFLEAGKSLGAKTEASPADWADALAAAVAGLQARGKAEVGDKTMVDALVPARDELRAAADGGADVAVATARAADAAERGRDSTEPLVARKGRASYLGERSAGHVDPGAVSAALLLRCAADTLPA